MTRTHTDEHGLKPLRTNAARPCRSVSVRVVFLALSLALAFSAPALAAEREADTPFCRIFDTGTASREALSDDAVAGRAGWRQVAENDLAHKFTGNAVLANDKLVVVLRKGAWSAEVYSATVHGMKQRAVLLPPPRPSGASWSLAGLAVVENTPGAASLEAKFAWGAEDPCALTLRLTTGESVLELRPGKGYYWLVATTRSRYVIGPDFFADDMVFSPEAFLGTNLDLPVENSFLGLVEDCVAMVMCIWPSSRQRASLSFHREGQRGSIADSGIDCVGAKSVWLGFLEGKGIWHSRAAGAKDDWKPPFPAKWRCSVAGKDGLAVSYDYEKGPPPGVTLPDGPMIVYPIDRTKATPLTTVLPIDVMRNTLGVGPCQYVLQAEGLASEANPTPEQVSHWVEQQFRRKKEKAARDDIKDRLAQMADHVGRVQTRIGQYGESAKQLRTLCQKHAGDASAARCLAILDHLDQAAAMKGDEPKTAKQLGDAVVALIGKENALEECQKLGEQIRAIGSAQDAALARCRLHVRRLRAECASRPASALSRQLEPLVGRVLEAK